MKGFLYLFLLIVGCFGQTRPDNYEYDGVTKSARYQACTTALASTQGKQEGGTACIVYDPLGLNLHFSIAHSINPSDVSSVTVTVGATSQTFTSSNDDGTKSPLKTDSENLAITDVTRFYLTRVPITGAMNAQVTVSTATTVVITLTAVRGPSGSLGSSNALTLTFTFDYGLMVQAGATTTRRTVTPTTERHRFTNFMETFYPLSTRVLLSRYSTGKQQQQYWTNNQLAVVAIGNGVNQTLLSEGKLVYANMAKCFTQMVRLNSFNYPVDDVLSFSPYCWVDYTDVYGVVTEKSYGANRYSAGVGHIKQANPTGNPLPARNIFGAGFY